MHRLPAYIKAIAAVFLLALLLYIPVEKNSHGHAVASAADQQDQTAFKAGYSCLICDFQLGTAAGIPDEPGIKVCIILNGEYDGCLPELYFSQAPSSFAERGPPSSC